MACNFSTVSLLVLRLCSSNTQTIPALIFCYPVASRASLSHRLLLVAYLVERCCYALRIEMPWIARAIEKITLLCGFVTCLVQIDYHILFPSVNVDT